jgi:DNA repair exonuclease SbcCD ATPase subunit
MKELKLLSLELKNFKGVRSFKFDANGKNIKIFGRNKAGKTTLFDSFLWLLFDKDSRGQAQFDIKTKDGKTKEVIHGLDHKVKGTFSIGGSQLTLEKVYMEKWTKKRGSAEEQFTGHTTDYYISGVPVKKKEYDEKINELVDEKVFRLLTDPRYFNEQLHWEERREILLNVCGDITDEDVIAANNDLKQLKDILEERTIDEHQKVIASKKKKINKDLEKIPVRIDEVNNNIPELPDLEKEKIKKDIEVGKKHKKGLEKKLSGIENGGEVAEKRKKLAEMDTELQQIKHDHTERYDEKIKNTKEEIEEVKDQLSELDRKITNKKLKLSDKKERIEIIKGEMNELRESWNKVNSEEINVEDKCPTCGQKLPEDEIEDAVKKAKLDKSQRLENINQNGVQKKQKVEKLKSETAELEEEIQSLEEQLPGLKKVKDDLFDDLSELREKAEAYHDSFKYKKKLKERENVEETIKELQENKADSKAEIKENIKEVESEINDLQAQLNKFDQKEKAQERIEELSAQEKELAQKYEKLEHELYLTEDFIRTKVDLLEDKINSHFDYTEFKLFEEQVNGGLKETCEAMDKEDGAIFGNTLNTGSEFKVGVDIINTLSEYYDFRAPIWIDGRESITEPIDTKSQLISLIVSAEDEKLRVEEVEKEQSRKEDNVA